MLEMEERRETERIEVKQSIKKGRGTRAGLALPVCSEAHPNPPPPLPIPSPSPPPPLRIPSPSSPCRCYSSRVFLY